MPRNDSIFLFKWILEQEGDALQQRVNEADNVTNEPVVELTSAAVTRCIK
jgi:hypothetical protein